MFRFGKSLSERTLYAQRRHEHQHYLFASLKRDGRRGVAELTSGTKGARQQTEGPYIAD